MPAPTGALLCVSFPVLSHLFGLQSTRSLPRPQGHPSPARYDLGALRAVMRAIFAGGAYPCHDQDQPRRCPSSRWMNPPARLC